jgi:hypothetical protein
MITKHLNLKNILKHLPAELSQKNAYKTEAFEKYLKSGSGHAFAKRYFW